MSINSVVNDTVTSVSVVNALKPLPPTISGYSVAGKDDLALDPAGGQTVQINGTGFLPGATITFDGSAVAVVTYVNPNQLTFTSPAKTAGTYTIYAVNPDGGTAIYVPGIIYSTLPTWTTTAGSLGSYFETTSISNTVVAAGDAPVTYSLFSGSLPTGSTLSANGVITGTAPVDGSSTTYSFTIQASDAQLQDSTRSFSLTINVDAVTWVSPANATTYTSAVDSAIANVTLSATDAAGYAVSYSANALPTGLSISGSNISGTPTVIADSSTLLTATAATTNRTATRTINWSITVANDPYFEYNTLLIPGASTTFVDDASTNNFAVTINGDTKPNNFNPYTPGYYSNYFDGSGDYLSLASTSTLAFGTGDFCVEMYYYQTTNVGIGLFSNSASVGGGEAQFEIQLDPINLYPRLVGWATVFLTSSVVSTLNKWNHLVVCRSGTTASIFLNGTRVATATVSQNFSSTNAFNIGRSASGGNTLTGYMSNVRAVKGTAVYDPTLTTLTVPTTPLTAIANTSLLTCQSNRFLDNSTNNFTITVAGNTTVNSFDPFVPNSSYSSYGSGYFDGTGDYLITPSDTAFTFGTGDFTIECWVYLTNSSATTQTIMGADLSVSTGSIQIWYNNVANKISFNVYGYPNFESTSTVSIGNWIHLAFTRSSGTFKMFINGTQSVSGSMTNNLPNNKFVIGRGFATIDAEYSYGYISDVRVVKGTAVYTTTFTPPSVPLTAISGTSLLTLQNNQPVNNSTFLDNSTNNFFVTRNGNTTQGTFSPYGGNWSNYFDGNGDYLNLGTTVSNFLCTGSATGITATFEAWVYPTAYSTGASEWMYSPVHAKGNTYLNFGVRNGAVRFYWWDGGAKTVTSSSTNDVPLNTWTHITVTINGTTIKIYVNGVLNTTSATYTGILSEATTFGDYIGAEASASNTRFFGYISNYRLTTTVVYSSAFTPSTTPLTAISGTKLLTCQSNRFIDNSTNNFAITVYDNPSVQRFSPFNPTAAYSTSTIGGSGYFDGTGDYLNLNGESAFAFGSSANFTIQFWFYATAISADVVFYDSRPTTTQGLYPTIYLNGTTKVISYVTNSTEVITGTTTIVVNQWYYVTLSRNSGSTRLFVNGIQQSATYSDTINYANPANRPTIMQSGYASNGYLTGYVTDFQVVTGTAVYTSNFVPPSAPISAVQNTSLLLNMTSASTYDAAMINDIESIGTAVLSTSTQKFNGSNSMYFPSASSNASYMKFKTPQSFLFGTGNFTVEMWVNESVVNNSAFYIGDWSPSTGRSSWGFARTNALFGSSELNFFAGTSYTTMRAAWTPTANTWYHIAVSRSGSSLRLFVDGTQIGTTFTYADAIDNTYGSGSFYINNTNNIGNWCMQGYINNLRVTSGYARYTANFTPPTSAFSVY